ncbi:hypothetical protein TNCV_1739841 [Trichonephila clavipes]|nr:hypothetical protein TNCV_1739841 [Trichonephila clavipes]
MSVSSPLKPFVTSPAVPFNPPPLNSPTKIIAKTQEPNKSTATKWKEIEDGFTSPSSRQISKNRRTIYRAERNFKIDLQNKFDNLKIDQIAGSSSTEINQSHSK